MNQHSTIEGDRRQHPRVQFVRPCKVFSPALQRYFPGETQDVSKGGMMIRIARLAHLQPGEAVHVGVAVKRREQLLRAGEMVTASIVRSACTVDDHTLVAVRLDGGCAEVSSDMRVAA